MLSPTIRPYAIGSMRAIACAALIGLCAACSTPPEKSVATHEKRIYRTGSNIAVHEGSSGDVKMVDPQSMKQQVDSQQRAPLPGHTGG